MARLVSICALMLTMTIAGSARADYCDDLVARIEARVTAIETHAIAICITGVLAQDSMRELAAQEAARQRALALMAQYHRAAAALADDLGLPQVGLTEAAMEQEEIALSIATVITDIQADLDFYRSGMQSLIEAQEALGEDVTQLIAELLHSECGYGPADIVDWVNRVRGAIDAAEECMEIWD